MRLPYRAPYDWDAMIGFLAARAIPGVESGLAAPLCAHASRVGGAPGVVTVVAPAAGDRLA